MTHRKDTLSVKIGENLVIGGSNEVVIQSMCNIKTSNVEQVANQINACAKAGAKLMRVSVLDEQDALAIKEIKERITIPLVADIHFDHNLAILAMKSGADKIRINPGNIGGEKATIEVIEAAKKYGVAIRIGVNSGSMDKEVYNYDTKLSAKHMVESLKKYIDIFEKHEFYNLVLSLKSTDVLETIEAYTLASKMFKYPLHIGITEAGIKDTAIIRSCAGLAPLLYLSIGNTIRISITGDPIDEVITAKKLLHDLGLYENYATLISCPTCGRTKVNLEDLATKVNEYLVTHDKNITVAIMGCIVNGPGEAKNADIGLAGGTSSYAIFKKGQIIKKVSEEDALAELIKEIENL